MRWRILFIVAIIGVFLSKLVGGTLPPPTMLTEPFLQLPGPNSIYVVWFTEFSGTENYVTYGKNLEKYVAATTKQLTKVAEDSNSHVTPAYQQLTKRKIWRHQALVDGLTPGESLPYQVVSKEGPKEVKSKVYSLTPQPDSNTPVKILLTSDHQLMPMTAANLEKVASVVTDLDGIFFAGDLVNIPDRASEWFDDQRGNAFFPCLQGKANYSLSQGEVTTTYRGAELIQNIPLFPAIGNHEVMGRYSREDDLNQQFDKSWPREQAEISYQQQSSQINPQEDPEIKATWIKDNSFNVDTYREIFTLPGNEEYYSVNFGNVWLGVLYVTNMWRSPNISGEVKGRYREKTADLEQPQNWGYGQHIFGAIAKDTPQYQWLQKELTSPAFTAAKYKIVMFHHPPHSLGGNVVPPYTTPQQQKKYDANSQLQEVTYDYPQSEDYIIRDLLPLLKTAGVDLVFYGHSHLWNRFYDPDSQIHFLESSNVGNSYGAYWGNSPNRPPRNYLTGSAAKGNPNGLDPILPTIDPLQDEKGNPLPYLASNDWTAFSILDTSKGTVSSYRFDTRKPHSQVIKFDEFMIGQGAN